MMREQTLRVSEIFGGTLPGQDIIPVIQGEGRFVGTPSIFVRLFGCNLRCPGFGNPNFKIGTKNQEVKEIVDNLVDFKTLQDLPRVKTGCDTYYAVYPEFKSFAKDYTIHELVKAIQVRLYTEYKPPHLVFTGGEPLLWQTQLSSLLKELESTRIKDITFETNGTIELSQKFIDTVRNTPFTITWSVSPKLTCSGHNTCETLDPAALRSYNKIPNSKLYLKFVVDKGQKTLDELLIFTKRYALEGVEVDNVYLMPEGGNFDESYKANRTYVVGLCSYLGFNYSPRLQVELFDNVVGS